jgi:hypothetical protein
MNMRVLIHAVLITLAINSAGYANDKTLWIGAELGMTPAQVLKVFPDARKNPEPKTVKSSKSYIIIPSRIVHDVKFEVSFYFNDKGLAQVTLESKPCSSGNSELMENLLREKYGTPISIKNYGIVRNLEWFDAPTSITLLYYPAPTDRTLYIIYNRDRNNAINSL